MKECETKIKDSIDNLMKKDVLIYYDRYQLTKIDVDGEEKKKQDEVEYEIVSHEYT